MRASKARLNNLSAAASLVILPSCRQAISKLHLGSPNPAAFEDGKQGKKEHLRVRIGTRSCLHVFLRAAAGDLELSTERAARKVAL